MARRRPSEEEIQELRSSVDRAKNAVRDALEAIEEIDDEPESEDGIVLARTMPAQKPSTSKQDYATPEEVIKAVERRFGNLVHDLAAHSRNARCVSYYSLEEGVDSLKQSWAKQFPNGNLWLNPEFKNIGPWAAKCFEESRKREGLIIMLTPASVGAEWFAEHVEKKALVIGLRPRISFDGKNPYPKDCMLSVYGLDPNSESASIAKRFGTNYGPSDYLSGFETWRWDREEAT